MPFSFSNDDDISDSLELYSDEDDGDAFVGREALSTCDIGLGCCCGKNAIDEVIATSQSIAVREHLVVIIVSNCIFIYGYLLG
mmetsp:Transcript_29967/g.43785  ORF Transcript_29967/g.43785 Transcript_29967/m.43785 type:complete len:83 (-) Transcript_29967:60-308(-)